ncbi:MAG: hypothetical protein Q7K40_05315 [bacterium]|nr:hypothetical protein [bacterium]
MKTKLLILFGITLAGLSAFAVAQNQDIPIWKQDLQNMKFGGENLSDDISALLTSMQGIQAEESAYLDDDKAIYVSRPNDLNEKSSRRKIADDADYIFGTQGDTVLFGKNSRMIGEAGGSELWITDVVSGTSRKFSNDVVNWASISPSGKLVAISTLDSFEISLFSKDGVLLKKINGNGTAPLFSPDSKFLAYVKLASSGLDLMQGIAVYNIETQKETILTVEKDDYEPIAFSPDGRKLYFNSGRGQGLVSDQYKGAPFQTPLWVVDLLSGDVKQLDSRSEKGQVVFLQRNSIIHSSDGSAMISMAGDGLGVINFNKDGDAVSAKFVGPNGTNLRWFKQDEIIAYRTKGFKGKYWEFFSIK